MSSWKKNGSFSQKQLKLVFVVLASRLKIQTSRFQKKPSNTEEDSRDKSRHGYLLH